MLAMDEHEERCFYAFYFFAMCFGLFANIRYNNKDLLKRRIKFFTFTFSAEVKISNSKKSEYYTKE